MFWNKIAGLYDLFENIYNKKVYTGTGKKVAEYINSEDEVLECACGTGAISIYIAEKCKKIIFMIENGEDINFIVSGSTKQVLSIKAKEIMNVAFRLIPLIRKQELKLPTIKIYEMNFDSADKICSNYYFLDKIYVI